ncbi:MAG: copper resistance CopC/CopD family protein [Beijerinckiaceae bacterium]
MMRLRACLLAAVVFAFSCAGALAHAYLVESRPADGDLLREAPRFVELLFNEPVEITTASHVDPGGEVSRLPVAPGKASRVEIALPAGIAEGSHLVSYRVVSEDGHTVGGSVVFSVGRASGGRRAGEDEPTINLSPLSAPLVLARFLLLVGLVFGAGAAAFAALFRPARDLRPFVLATLAAGALAAFVSIGLQGADAHGLGLAALNDRAMWRSGLRLPQGVGALVALIAIASASAALFVTGAAARTLGLAAVAFAAIALAWGGHARLWRPEALMQGFVFAHVACAIIWAGALLPLANASRSPDFASVLRRFSVVAAPLYIVLIASGASLALTQFFGPRDAFETAWGMTLAAKLALAGVVTLFAVINRTLFTPAALRGDRGALKLLRRSIRFEAALAVAILAAASAWRLTPPPVSLGAPNQRAFQIHIHGTQAMASMAIRPARAGPVHVRIEPKAADLSPLRVQEVDLSLTPDAPGVAPIRRKARLVSGVNVWEVEDLTIPAPGTWRIRVDLLIDDFDRTQLDAVITLRP